MEELKQYVLERPYLPNKKFCASIISNGGAYFRNNFIEELSKYKQIDNGGHYRNNIGRVIPRTFEDKKLFLRDYKFSIAMENAKNIGYNTEKLMEAFLGHVYYLFI